MFSKESLAILCAEVGANVNLLELMPGFQAATLEKDLPDGYGNVYALGGTYRERIKYPGLLLRKAWAEGAAASTSIAWFSEKGPFPLFSLKSGGRVGALTSTLKCCYRAGNLEKARVSLDLDGNNPNAPFPSPDQIFLAASTFLQANTTAAGVDYAKEPCIVFMLTCSSKERSCHVIFPGLHFGQIPENMLGKAHPLTQKFNLLVNPLGFEADFSICNSGLRWEFGDKFPPNKTQSRGAVAVPFFFNIDNPKPSWAMLADAIDPHVLPSDATREVNWIIPEDANPRPVQRRAVEQQQQQQVLQSTASTAEKRLADKFPELANVPMRRTNRVDGVVKLEPQTNFCPFKNAPSTDMPVHQHKSPKLYAFEAVDGTVTLHCGVCSGQRIVIEAPIVRHAHCLDYFNTRYLLMASGDVLKLPEKMQNGDMSEYTIVPFSKFSKMEDRSNLHPINIAPQGTKAKMVKQFRFWYDHASVPRIQRIVFDPSCTHAADEYNTWRGFDRRVLACAATMEEWSDEQLLQKYENTRKLVFANICSSDKETECALWNFFTDMVVNTARKPGYGVCCFGPQGCGKGLTAQFFLKLVGRAHGRHGDATSLSDTYNYQLAELVLLFADEGNPDKSTKGLNMLKQLVTETSMEARRKYQDNRNIENTCQRIFVASNNDPVVVENKDRRWLCLNGRYALGDEHSAEFRELIDKVVAERESCEGPAAFLVYAKRHGVRPDFSINVPIATPARWELKHGSMNPYELYLYHVCCSGEIVSGTVELTKLSKHQRLGWEAACRDIGCEPDGLCGHGMFERVPSPKLPLCAWWIGFLVENNYRAPNNCTDSTLAKFLYAVISKATLTVVKNTNVNGWNSFVAPPLQTLRAAYAAYLGQPADKIYDDWAME